jgi:hypothetical protein
MTPARSSTDVLSRIDIVARIEVAKPDAMATAPTYGGFLIALFRYLLRVAGRVVVSIDL